MSDIYSEYFGDGRRATVTKIPYWDPNVTKWEVALYVGDKPLQRSTLFSQQQAEDLAEDFVQGQLSAPTLLNEHISNG